jgi:glycerophosphoryl diester phosphodiesterase
MALRTLARRLIGRVYHRLRPFKHIENSPRGALLAKRAGDPALDIDLHITRDGVIVAAHDGQPGHYGFFDPLGVIHRDAKIRNLTWAQVSRLRCRTGWRLYRIHRIEDLLRACHRYGRIALIEPKGDPRFSQDWPWQYLAEEAEAAGTTVSVRALVELGGRAHIAAARRAGFQAWLI